MRKHIAKRTSELTVLQRGYQTGLVHHLAARHVDQLRARRQQRERVVSVSGQAGMSQSAFGRT